MKLIVDFGIAYKVTEKNWKAFLKHRANGGGNGIASYCSRSIGVVDYDITDLKDEDAAEYLENN